MHLLPPCALINALVRPTPSGNGPQPRQQGKRSPRGPLREAVGRGAHGTRRELREKPREGIVRGIEHGPDLDRTLCCCLRLWPARRARQRRAPHPPRTPHPQPDRLRKGLRPRGRLRRQPLRGRLRDPKSRSLLPLGRADHELHPLRQQPHRRTWSLHPGGRLNGNVYVNGRENDVAKYKPSSFPPDAGATYDPDTTVNSTGVLAAEGANGVAIDPATDNVYVSFFGHISSYEPDGTPISETIGEAATEGGALFMGIAVRGRAGKIYVYNRTNLTAYVLSPDGSKSSPKPTAPPPRPKLRRRPSRDRPRSVKRALLHSRHRWTDWAQGCR